MSFSQDRRNQYLYWHCLSIYIWYFWLSDLSTCVHWKYKNMKFHRFKNSCVFSRNFFYYKHHSYQNVYHILVFSSLENSQGFEIANIYWDGNIGKSKDAYLNLHFLMSMQLKSDYVHTVNLFVKIFLIMRDATHVHE